MSQFDGKMKALWYNAVRLLGQTLPECLSIIVDVTELARGL